MQNRDQITVSHAMRLAESWGYPVSRPTIIVWTKKYNLGKQIISGKTCPFYIDKKRFVVAVKALRQLDKDSLLQLERWRFEKIK